MSDAALPAPPARDERPAAPLGLLEVLERDGRLRRAQPVQRWPLTIGRAWDNDVVLDDPHVAAHHARIDAAPGQAPTLLALPSLNPVQIGRRRLRAGERAPLADPARGDGGFVIGTTRLRLRLPGEPLAPERPLAAAPRRRVTLGLALLLWAWLAVEHALALDPGSKAADWLLPLLGAPAALALWSLLWALASKLFQHRFDFGPHLAVATRGLLAAAAVGFALPWASALSGWSGPSRVAPGAAAACAAWLLFAHARLVLPHLRRALAGAVAVLYVLGSGIGLALNQQRLERWFGELYVARLPPPALQWRTPESRAQFVEHAAGLRPRLQRHVRDAAEDADAADADED